MTRFTDGEKTVEIAMNYLEDNNLSPDMTADIFDVGQLEKVYSEEIGEAYKVNDVDYIIDYAKDWQSFSGDFCDLDTQEDYEEKGIELILNIVER